MRRRIRSRAGCNIYSTLTVAELCWTTSTVRFERTVCGFSLSFLPFWQEFPASLPNLCCHKKKLRPSLAGQPFRALRNVWHGVSIWSKVWCSAFFVILKLTMRTEGPSHCRARKEEVSSFLLKKARCHFPIVWWLPTFLPTQTTGLVNGRTATLSGLCGKASGMMAGSYIRSCLSTTSVIFPTKIWPRSSCMKDRLLPYTSKGPRQNCHQIFRRRFNHCHRRNTCPSRTSRTG